MFDEHVSFGTESVFMIVQDFEALQGGGLFSYTVFAYEVIEGKNFLEGKKTGSKIRNLYSIIVTLRIDSRIRLPTSAEEFVANILGGY